MSAEYSVEEVRDIANKQRATMPYTAMLLTDYADLLERIKADESAVPAGEVFGPKAVSTMVALAKPLPPGTKLFTRPPAQSVDVRNDAENWGNALNDAAWTFTDVCPEKSALLFNHTKPALRAAILKYLDATTAALTEKGNG